MSKTKNNNKWFKHWNSAHQGQTISQLWAERDGPEVIAFYWTVLELVSQFEDLNNRGNWDGNLSIFKSKLGMNRNRSYKLLCKICVTFETKITWKSQESFQLFIPNWLELQETRGGKREPKLDQKPDRRKKKEVRSKILSLPLSSGDEVGNVESHETLESSDKVKFKPSDLVELWNQLRSPSLPAVMKLTDSRKRAAARALQEYPEEEFWRDVIKIVNGTPFLLGESRLSGDRSKAWRCDFDFIVRKDNALKIIEGKYS